MAKQFLRIHDTSFASRPALDIGKYTSYNYSDMTWAPYGPHWRQARKIYLSEVFSENKLESFKHIHIEEEHNFHSRLHSFLENQLFYENIYFVIISHLFVEWCDQYWGLDTWLSFLDLQGYVKKMKDLYKKLDKFHNYVIDDHLDRRKADKDHFVPKDVVDVLLQLAEDPNLEVKLTRDCIKGLFQNLLVGGTDTSATTVEWTIHELIKQPRIIQKAKEELDRVIGRNRWVEENDFSQLPYIEAIIKESFRLHPLATFLAPHYAIEDCNVAGYDISKGTTILINTWSIGRDPNSWSEPEKFLPERFLGKEIDILGSNFALLPFGSGRRSQTGCPIEPGPWDLQSPGLGFRTR
ncbi:hypothetical protein RD792_000670 [Penstemon davidsonii]|uniref:Cytochrome P450 n=1 Tax=Penstemon davidsonii TaxID=160366 RepID=A0ABR0DMC6_9LAMI|nr:hypothetical protein RD792_000670 [Penstemon davidsonii]